MIEHFLLPGEIYAGKEPAKVSTLLGSCVSVCLYDVSLSIGGINHYMLPLWNGEGLASPKYGNVAMNKLLEKMYSLGCKKQNLKAKVFGGGAVLDNDGNISIMKVGDRNIDFAMQFLELEGIPVIAKDVGGIFGRKLLLKTDTFEVFVKKIQRSTK